MDVVRALQACLVGVGSLRNETRANLLMRPRETVKFIRRKVNGPTLGACIENIYNGMLREYASLSAVRRRTGN
jgi:hypothetical protein